MNIPRTMNTLIFVSLLINSSQAGVIPGRWEKLDGLEPGSKIVLTSKGGDRARYTFRKSDATCLTIRGSDGRERVIPKSHVAKIVKQNSRSSKPAWIGAGIGAGIGVAMGASVKSDEYPQAKWGVAALGLGAVGAAIGATTGYFITENPPDELLYEDNASNSNRWEIRKQASGGRPFSK